MTSPFKALLPSGFYDLLSPDAAHEAQLIHKAMGCFAQFGYLHIKPPLVEFEDSLLDAASPGVDRQTFRLMDPITQRMMGLRADMTMQIGRVALTRMKDAPRPLRLCYNGTTLNTVADTLNPTRQHTQVGFELIGVNTVASDAETIMVAVQALQALGVKNITVDLHLPSLVPTLLDKMKLDKKQRETIIHALVNKNIAPMESLNKQRREVLQQLCSAVGPAKDVLKTLLSMKLPVRCVAMLERLQMLMTALKPIEREVTITIDPTENRGFDYETGIAFSIFASGIDGEIGRGGRYTVAFDEKNACNWGYFIHEPLVTTTPGSKSQTAHLPACRHKQG